MSASAVSCSKHHLLDASAMEEARRVIIRTQVTVPISKVPQKPLMVVSEGASCGMSSVAMLSDFGNTYIRSTGEVCI
jgi:hypothetical protein